MKETDFKQKQKEFFDYWAEKEKPSEKKSYFEWFFTEYLNSYVPRELEKFLEEFSGKAILEAGCGAGQYTEFIARKKPKVKITATDISEKSISAAKKSFKEKGIQNVSFQVEDAEELNFSEEFDAIVAVNLLHHLPGFNALVQFNKVLKKDGKLFLIDIVKDNPLSDFMRFCFNFAPESAKLGLKEELIDSSGKAVSSRRFSSRELKKALQQNGFVLLREKRFHFALPVLYYLDKVLPIFRKPCGKRCLGALEGMENFLVQKAGFWRFTDAIVLVARKT